jgi:prophage tail gpP-like protein
MKARVNGMYFMYFNEVVISTSLDAVASTFSFVARYDPDIPGHNELFRPLSYAKIEFFDDNSTRPLSTGTIVDWNFASEADPTLKKLSGYSLPGVLEDCQIPYSLYPLESNNRNLQQITDRLLKPFGLKLIVYDIVKKECAQIIARTVAKPEETIKNYICSIANQKNVIVSHDIFGNLIMFRPDVKSQPKLTLTPENTTKMNLHVNGREIHSEITTLRQPSKGDNPDEAFGNINITERSLDDFIDKGETLKISSSNTVKNKLVTAYRPMVDKLTRLSFWDTDRAAKNMRGAELKNVRITFELDRWEKVSIGDIIEVDVNPELFINKKVKMILESTTIQENSKTKTLSGSLVLLETFTGDEPQNIFG